MITLWLMLALSANAAAEEGAQEGAKPQVGILQPADTRIPEIVAPPMPELDPGAVPPADFTLPYVCCEDCEPTAAPGPRPAEAPAAAPGPAPASAEAEATRQRVCATIEASRNLREAQTEADRFSASPRPD